MRRRDLLRDAFTVTAAGLLAPRARGLILSGGSAASSSYIPWTPAYYQNFDSLPLGTAVINTFGGGTVDNTKSYSSSNSAKFTVSVGSPDFGGSYALPTSIQPAAGNEVWFRLRTYFPAGFDFTADGFGSGNGLKFMRIETDPIGSHAPAHIDCYLLGGNATAVGGFDFIYEGATEGAMFGGSDTTLPSGIIRGQFQTWEIYYKLSSTDAGAIWRMWRNGTLILDTSRGIPSAATPLINLAGGYNIPGNNGEAAGFYFSTFWNGNSRASQEAWVDDFTIATDLVSRPTAIDSYGNNFIGMGNPS